MRINGRKIEKPNEEYLVLPRKDGDIVFRAVAVLDMSDFDRFCPPPKPPLGIKRGGKRFEDIEDPKYVKALNVHAEKRMAFLVIKSLEGTEGLEWETVKLTDHTTWNNYEKELKNSGFSQIEINRIITCVFTANSLNEQKLEEARETFLAGLSVNETTSSPTDGLQIMPSGEPANDSE